MSYCPPSLHCTSQSLNNCCVRPLAELYDPHRVFNKQSNRQLKEQLCHGCCCTLNKHTAINIAGAMFVLLIRQTKGRDVLAALCKLGWVRNQLVLHTTVQILIPSCANHHNTISADKLSPIYRDN